jgi:hypothetical protein
MQKLVLEYLTTTRSDITYVVHQLFQHMSKLRTGHYQAALRKIHYLKGNPSQGLLYLVNSQLHRKAFIDVDWATCPTTIRPTTHYKNALIY